ncbi:hypothetical protein LX36DRAFT_407274 [Colletotrichum falcatum]|nr:hypothetical protein LX36DRAFT_407274 [Colletotrichum falcatum]
MCSAGGKPRGLDTWSNRDDEKLGEPGSRIGLDRETLLRGPQDQLRTQKQAELCMHTQTNRGETSSETQRGPSCMQLKRHDTYVDVSFRHTWARWNNLFCEYTRDRLTTDKLLPRLTAQD